MSLEKRGDKGDVLTTDDVTDLLRLGGSGYHQLAIWQACTGVARGTIANVFEQLKSTSCLTSLQSTSPRNVTKYLSRSR